MGCGSSSQVAVVKSDTKPYPVQKNQPQPPPQPQPQPAPLVNVKKISPNAFTKADLYRYVELEKQINVMESRKIGINYQLKSKQLKELEKKMENFRQELTFQRNTMSGTGLDGKRSVKEVASEFLFGLSSEKADLTGNQEEILESLGSLQMLETAYAQAEHVKTKLESEVQILKSEAKVLDQLYIDQEKLLSNIFNGHYGSSKEMSLEEAFHSASEWYYRISSTKTSWQSARVLVFHASNQLSVACTRWQSLMRIPLEMNSQVCITLATETKNNLTTSLINMKNALVYLGSVNVPYCQPSELKTVELASNNVYSDMRHEERQKYALQCYLNFYQRSCALLQWLDNVLTKQIQRDLDVALNNYEQAYRALRIERVSLLQSKLKEELNETVNIDLDADGNFLDAKQLRLALAGADILVPVAMSDGKTSDKKVSDAAIGTDAKEAETKEMNIQQSEDPEVSKHTTVEDIPNKPVHIPLEELAPAPSSDQLFGELNLIQQRHEKAMNDFNHAQDENRDRMTKNLEERLAARKSRRKPNVEE